MRDLPSGTVTFLFTDIEGSTKLLHQLGSARRDAYRRKRSLRLATPKGGVFQPRLVLPLTRVQHGLVPRIPLELRMDLLALDRGSHRRRSGRYSVPPAGIEPATHGLGTCWRPPGPL
jgi:hypothetical protein